jgi:DNA polymerase
VPFYHPAAALHRPSLRSVVEEDFAKLPVLIDGAEKVPVYQLEEPVDNNNDQVEQLSLF